VDEVIDKSFAIQNVLVIVCKSTESNKLRGSEESNQRIAISHRGSIAVILCVCGFVAWLIKEGEFLASGCLISKGFLVLIRTSRN